MENKKYRMYVFVERHLSPIDKGIQGAHAIVEYSCQSKVKDEYLQWAEYDKTIIMLNGGTVHDLIDIRNVLLDNDIPFSQFIESDMNMLTAIAVLVEEKVYATMNLNDYITKLLQIEKEKLLEIGQDDFLKYGEEKWVKLLGGENNRNLYELIKSKRLA